MARSCGDFASAGLQPPLLASQASRFRTVGGAELTDGFGEVIAHGALGEVDLLGDLGVGEAFAGDALCGLVCSVIDCLLSRDILRWPSTSPAAMIVSNSG